MSDVKREHLTYIASRLTTNCDILRLASTTLHFADPFFE